MGRPYLRICKEVIANTENVWTAINYASGGKPYHAPSHVDMMVEHGSSEGEGGIQKSRGSVMIGLKEGCISRQRQDILPIGLQSSVR